jgi:hypothetical protein
VRKVNTSAKKIDFEIDSARRTTAGPVAAEKPAVRPP